LSAVPYTENDNDVTADLEQDLMSAPPLAVEELAQPLPVPLGLGSLGAALGVFFERVDRGEKGIPPTVRRGL
jgi:hypothetical protein